MINYILQVVLFQVLFLAVYDFFLQKETFFKWNRLYLLLTPILAFIIPLLKFESIQKSVPTQYVEKLPTVFLNPQAVILQTVEIESSINFWQIVFYIGIALFLTIFLIKLYKIIQLITTHEVVKSENIKLVLLENKESAFSFFNYIFIKRDFIKNKELSIIQHEMVHCKQLHTLDLLFFELLKIVMWFNPMVYVFQKRITLLHEYISDAEVVQQTDKNNYFNTILAETFNVENISFINQFYKQSLIKKRIVMITKEKSREVKQLKYLLLIPLLVAMLVYSSCTNDVKFDIDEVEAISKNDDIPSEGKYFEGDYGKIYVGNELNGEIVTYEKMTDNEKELFGEWKAKNKSNIPFQIIINSNGDRVLFIKVDRSQNTNLEVDYYEEDNVPFAIIEDVPVYPGCEGTQEELKTCLQKNITNHVSANFNSDLAKGLGLKAGVKKIFVMFKIDKEGAITDVQARGPHQSLADEAIRVINLLPKMIPGKQKGENVGVKYSLPIAFKVE